VTIEKGSDSPGGRSSRSSSVLGFFLILSGLLLNKWALGKLLAPDGTFESSLLVGSIIALEALLVAAGIGTLALRPAILHRSGLAVTSGLVLTLLIAAGAYGNVRAMGYLDPHRVLNEAMETMLMSEEFILKQTPEIKNLAKSAMDLKVPDHHSAWLFDENVAVIDLDLGAPAEVKREVPAFSLKSRQWPVAKDLRATSREELSLWRPLFDQISHFKHAKFYFIRGTFPDMSRESYVADIGFAGLARVPDGSWWSVSAAQKVTWRNLAFGSGGEAKWRIAEWRTERLGTIEAPRPAFREVLDGSIGSAETLQRARRSLHEELLLNLLLEKPYKKPFPEFSIASFDQHPGLAVVDVDADGHDDIYLMERMGRNMLLRNLGDGTFEDIAPEIGLDLESSTNAALFADFDNDGDQDAFLGQSLRRSVYMRNEGGRFVDRTDTLVKGRLPYLASSVSAADFDGDGLLDVYFATYGALTLDREMFATKMKTDRLLADYLSEEDAIRLREIMREAEVHRFADRPGPPNMLFKNTGAGGFVDVSEESGLKLFKNTYQATWADYDDDGDPDLYCASDFAPNNMYRNDGGGRFTDVTEPTGTADVGFGMGAAWGDYDEDGRQDLYVSNMFSKAGQRITAMIPGLDPRFAQMARGNSLFKNRQDQPFEKVSGRERPALEVEIAGWSWGSQFLDPDNDGYLDLFALSGYYSAPDQIAIALDT